MEATRVDDLLSRAIDEQVAEYRTWREAMDALTARVDQLEAVIQSLRDDLADLVGDAARLAVRDAVDAGSDDLRRQISDLGRLIVNDLGKLPQIIRAASAPGQPDVDLRDRATASASIPVPVPVEAGQLLDLPYGEAGEERRGRFRKR